MRNCSVYKCQEKRGEGTLFHCFPNPKKDFERFKYWLDACNNPYLYKIPPEKLRNHFVCHKHFKSSDYSRNNIVFRASVPTLHLPAKESVVMKENISETTETPRTELAQKTNLSVLNESGNLTTNQTNSDTDKENHKKPGDDKEKGVNNNNNGNKKGSIKNEFLPARKNTKFVSDHAFYSKPNEKQFENEVEDLIAINIEDSVVIESDVNDNPQLEVVNKHFQGICITCMKLVENGEFTKFTIFEENDDLRQRILFAFSIDLHEFDDFGIVCKNCVNEIENAYIFKRRLSYIQTIFKKESMYRKKTINEIYKLNNDLVEKYEKELTSKVKKPKEPIKSEKESDNLELSKTEEQTKGNQVCNEENTTVTLKDVLKQQETVKLQLQESVSKLKRIKEKKGSVSRRIMECQFCRESFYDIDSYNQHKDICSINFSNESNSVKRFKSDNMEENSNRKKVEILMNVKEDQEAGIYKLCAVGCQKPLG